jgi:hypothetical protein
MVGPISELMFILSSYCRETLHPACEIGRLVFRSITQFEQAYAKLLLIGAQTPSYLDEFIDKLGRCWARIRIARAQASKHLLSTNRLCVGSLTLAHRLLSLNYLALLLMVGQAHCDPKLERETQPPVCSRCPPFALSAGFFLRYLGNLEFFAQLCTFRASSHELSLLQGLGCGN